MQFQQNFVLHSNKKIVLKKIFAKIGSKQCIEREKKLKNERIQAENVFISNCGSFCYTRKVFLENFVNFPHKQQQLINLNFSTHSRLKQVLTLTSILNCLSRTCKSLTYTTYYCTVQYLNLKTFCKVSPEQEQQQEKEQEQLLNF